jgi:hypothetical protein
MPARLPTLALLVPLALGTPPRPTDTERAEVVRIQRHFDGALELLAQRDLSGLTAEQRARRAALTGVLARYRDRGLFPRNYDFPGQAMPYFIDRRTGVLCAVAHLMESTGRRDLVERVADADNNVWVPELAGNAEFEAWLGENGLTLAEAARIQVPYVGDPPPQLVEGGSEALKPTALMAAGGTALLFEFVPQLKSSRTGAVLAFAAGTFATTAGAKSFDGTSDARLAGLTVASGLLNLYISGRSFSNYRASQRARRATLSPILPASREQGTGLMLSVSF